MQPDTIQDLTTLMQTMTHDQIVQAIGVIMTAMLTASDALCGQEFLLTAKSTGNSIFFEVPCLGDEL